MARCTDKLQILGGLLVLLGVVAILKYLQGVGASTTPLWGHSITEIRAASASY
jgi:hypothetical protein